ncbi:MAG: hypothetical protein KAT11_04150 [Phycisphaerae bacterium]|nr:hypothetical protein [Phycisphaerae bacterium]
MIGPIIGQFTGRRSETVKVKAKYKLRAGNLLILVDSPVGVARSSGVRAVLSRELEREIELHGLAASVIPASELSAFRSSREDFEELNIAQIGRELWAQQVLYVKVAEFQLGTLLDKPAGQGLIRGRVKVFDIEQNRRVWPEMDPLGQEVIVQTGFREAVGKDYGQDFTQELCQSMAVKIVKLFRDHKAPRGSADTK